MKFRFQIGSNSPLAKRNARMFSAASLPRKWSIRKICRSLNVSVHLIVECDRTFQVGAERFLHDHAGAFHQVRLAQCVDDLRRSDRRHAEVVQPADWSAELLLRYPDQLAQTLGPADCGMWVSRSANEVQCSSVVGGG